MKDAYPKQKKTRNILQFWLLSVMRNMNSTPTYAAQVWMPSKGKEIDKEM